MVGKLTLEWSVTLLGSVEQLVLAPGVRSRSQDVRSRSPVVRYRSPGERSRSPGVLPRSPGGRELGAIVRRLELGDEININRDGKNRYICFKTVTL
jgi:hypothetical protein